MEKITEQGFAIRQPYYPEHAKGEDYYLALARALASKIKGTAFGAGLHDALCNHLALTLCGYMQDIVADAGSWRSFVMANRQLYGYDVPFYSAGEDHVDFELNPEDIRFLCWYDIAMTDIERRDLYPYDPALLEMAGIVYDWLDARYDDTPVIEEYNVTRGVSLTDPNDRQEVFSLARWLFNGNWLLTPAYALTLAEMVNDPEVKADRDGILLQKRIDDAMVEDPTGPLALFLTEWLELILSGALPQSALHNDFQEPATPHKYYTRFTEATGGKETAYFRTYDELNRFFIEGMGWEKGEEHLANMKNDRDFVLMVNKAKGMLLSRGTARCIADPDNPLYDKEYARQHAMDLFTMRGMCPGDLLRLAFRKGWLPNARFYGSDDTDIVARYGDFIARCYLQQYYRGD